MMNNFQVQSFCNFSFQSSPNSFFIKLKSIFFCFRPFSAIRRAIARRRARRAREFDPFVPFEEESEEEGDNSIVRDRGDSLPNLSTSTASAHATLDVPPVSLKIYKKSLVP
jgi:hypothetical protein